MKKAIVITSINKKTNAIQLYESFQDWHVIVVGDKKSYQIEGSKNLTFLSYKSQFDLGFKLIDKCPYNHYTRKNIGYLYAFAEGAELIYETDDDNFPYDDWGFPDFCCSTQIKDNDKFVNIYRHFTTKKIWPRGFPLDEIQKGDQKFITEKSKTVKIGLWQSLADKDPDVDAIFRLVDGKNVIFNKKSPVYLKKGQYCPFNSQNTLWSKPVFSLMYLPALVSFRFTDILRGYIAQRLLWEKDLYLGFIRATVFQDRNKHDLMKDFIEEFECYVGIKKIINVLDKMKFIGNFLLDLQTAYTELVKNDFISKDELNVLNAWCEDCLNILV